MAAPPTPTLGGSGPDVILSVPRIGLLAAAIVVLLDQSSKTLADRALVPGRQVDVIGDVVGLQLVYNFDAALGASVPRWFFLTVTAVVTVIVARNLPRAVLARTAVAYGLLLAGAWGNGLDRVFRPPGFPAGGVVDFVALQVGGPLPRFNVADVAILTGFVVLLATMGAEERAVAAVEDHAEGGPRAARGAT